MLDGEPGGELVGKQEDEVLQELLVELLERRIIGILNDRLFAGRRGQWLTEMSIPGREKRAIVL